MRWLLIFLSSWDFASIEGIKKNCNPTEDLSKSISNKKILNDVTLFKVTTSMT